MRRTETTTKAWEVPQQGPQLKLVQGFRVPWASFS
jgi:hypothetical protein